jgi:hypothetical protein
VCAAAAKQNNAPVSLTGVKPRPMTKASPTNAPTATPRASNSSISAGLIPNAYHEPRHVF